MNGRLPLPPHVSTTKAIAVLRATHARSYGPVIAALRAGGVTSIELTLSTAGVVEGLPALIDEFAGEVELGVGTVTNLRDCQAVIHAGAHYVVTPVVNRDIAALCSAEGIPCIMGGFTPTELFEAWDAGASAVKLFPASTVGPGYLAQLMGPFPGMGVIPSGGVEIDDVPDWLRAGAVAVSIGGPLIRDGFAAGDLGELSERARRVIAAVGSARTG